MGDAGIIVAAPESSVVLTSPTDAGVLNSHRDRLIAQGQSRGILSPDEILERSSPIMHNEIVALGQSGLKAVGFFYKVDSQKYPINVDLMAAMYQLGGRMGLPVVGISSEKENPYIENKVIRSTSAESGEEEELRIFFDGRCYCVTESSSKPKYRAVDGDTLTCLFCRAVNKTVLVILIVLLGTFARKYTAAVTLVRLNQLFRNARSTNKKIVRPSVNKWLAAH